MLQRLRLASVLTLVAALAAPSLFGDDRHDGRTYRGSAFDRRPVNRGYSQRQVTLEGRIRDIDRSRNGFVIRLDNGYSFYANSNAQVRRASNRGTSRVRSLDRGDYVRVAGWLRSRSLVDAQSIYLVRDDRYNDGYYDDYTYGRQRTLTGVVESVERDGDFRLRDSRTGRVILVEIERGRHDHGYASVRRGDRVSVQGDWHNNHFVALDVNRQGFGW